MSTTMILLDGSRELTRDEVGGKAYSLNEMRRSGLPVPPAFVLPTRQCQSFRDVGSLTDEVWQGVQEGVRYVERETGRTFGSGPSPLLVSVRSGAAQSMPGMMDTVLNLGLTAELAQVLASETDDAVWAHDTLERFEESYRSIVRGDSGAAPQDPWAQLREAIGAVFRSWESPRAVAYRARHGLTDLAGTAVTVQAMVFGNRDADSGTGVLFTRDAGTGAPGATGDWLARAQGEEVVSGSRTPQALAEFAVEHPQLHAQLIAAASQIETDLGDMADVEFTVESGKLYVLQSRVGKRSPRAAVRIAVDLHRDGRLTTDEAIAHLSAEHIERLAESKSADSSADQLATGTGIGTGVASGIAVTDVDEAERLAQEGRDIVLVRAMTSPEDVPTMFQSVAVVTETGGPTSHAALVCREIGLPCVVGCGEGTIEALVGKEVTVDGTSGRITAGGANGSGAATDDYLQELLSWVSWPVASDHPLAPLAHLADAQRHRLEAEEAR